MSSNVRQKVVFASPRSQQERTSVADACVRNLHIEIPALLDDFSNQTENAYTGWPDRLYVIDRAGRIAFKSGAGPFGFEPGGVQATLQRLTGPQRPAQSAKAFE